MIGEVAERLTLKEVFYARVTYKVVGNIMEILFSLATKYGESSIVDQ